jgi:Na+-transporting NADH:ubiquinone oxidoreductase subunit E
MELISLALRAIFVENILLAFLLGMCSFLACSKRLNTAIGLGGAVVFVLTITTPINWLIHEYLLKPNAVVDGVDLSFLTFICFIAVIAVQVQVVEMVIEKFSPALYGALGIFLPLITVNCSILGTALFMVEREYNFPEALVFGFSSGIGWFLAIVGLASIREKLRYSHVPEGLKGLGITMFITGLMAMAFMAFGGI